MIHDLPNSTSQLPLACGPRILVVDDHDQVRRSNEVLLGALGYEVFTFASAAAACQFIESQGPPDVVLTDIRLGGPMDGVQLREWVRANAPQTAVILMSGYSEESLENDPFFLMKPFSVAELQEKLANCLVDRNVS